MKKIASKWAKISKERAKEDSALQNASPDSLFNEDASTGHYDLAVPSKHAITVSFDLDPPEVELALSTNAASLRTTTLLALLAAIVVDVPKP